jgi:hypothetical protein
MQSSLCSELQVIHTTETPGPGLSSWVMSSSAVAVLGKPRVMSSQAASRPGMITQ